MCSCLDVIQNSATSGRPHGLAAVPSCLCSCSSVPAAFPASALSPQSVLLHASQSDCRNPNCDLSDPLTLPPSLASSALLSPDSHPSRRIGLLPALQICQVHAHLRVLALPLPGVFFPRRCLNGYFVHGLQVPLESPSLRKAFPGYTVSLKSPHPTRSSQIPSCLCFSFGLSFSSVLYSFLVCLFFSVSTTGTLPLTSYFLPCFLLFLLRAIFL